MPTTLHSRYPATLTLGFGVMVAMWVAWFLMHMPVTAPSFPPVVAGPVLLGVLLVGLVVGLRFVPRDHRLIVGGMAGALAGAINLLVIGSKLSAPTEAGTASGSLIPQAGLVIAGWMALCTVIGFIAGATARGMLREVPAVSKEIWLGRFAWVATVAVLPLLTLGGLVTTAKAGFAVPDWPGTYGSNMFLYPIALMSEPRIFLEHTHRLFGTMVGVTTIALMLFTFAAAPRGRAWMKWFAAGLFVAVCVQGYIGGVWVQEKSIWMVLTHGTLGQLFFGAMAAFAVMLTPAWQRWADDLTSPARKSLPSTLVLVMLGALIMQLILGTMIRHMAASKGASHVLWTHVIFSLVVVTLTVIAGIRLMKLKETLAHGRLLYWSGHASMIIVGIQFVLGFVALLAYLSDDTRKIAAPVAESLATAPAIDPLKLLARTIHQANGAVLMAAAMAMVVVARVRRAA